MRTAVRAVLNRFAGVALMLDAALPWICKASVEIEQAERKNHSLLVSLG